MMLVYNSFLLRFRWIDAARKNELRFANSMSVLKDMYERTLQEQSYEWGLAGSKLGMWEINTLTDGWVRQCINVPTATGS